MKRDTACQDCPYKKQGLECPNYIETMWEENGNPQPVLIKDCAPRRSLLMLQELYNRTFGLQQQISQQEKEISETRVAVSRLFEAIKYMEDQRQVEKSAKEKFIRHVQTMKYCDEETFKRIDLVPGEQ